jgi:hypothetical protein
VGEGEGEIPRVVPLAGGTPYSIQVVEGHNTRTICFGPSVENYSYGTVDCEPQPLLWGMDWIGIDTTGQGAPCSSGMLCPRPISVDDLSWGRVKSMYR